MIVQLPRVGGTLLARLIGAQESCLLFSEVHPVRKGADLRQQARNYYGLRVTPWKRGYLRVLRDIARQSSKPVVLRDHTHLNFTTATENSYRLENFETVAQGFEVRPLALFRHPADQYLSCLSRNGMATYMTPALFAAGYVQFFRATQSFTRISYEDLTANTKTTLQHTARALDLALDSNRLEAFSGFHNVTGDGDQVSRGYGLSHIEKLPRRHGFETACAALAAEAGMAEICQELNYVL